jgi:hypothetical protein
MEPWFEDAKAISSLDMEVCFLLQDTFYYGPDTHPHVAERKLVEQLTPPEIPRKVAGMVRSSEATGYEQQLAAYYKQVVQLGRRHKKPFNNIRHYFWLRFWLWNSAEQVHVPFPWYDTYSEVDRFLVSLSSTRTGQVYYDRDQGWELEIQVEDDTLFVRNRDPDQDETHFVIAVPYQALLAQVVPLRQRTTHLIGQLAQALGADVWTTYIDMPLFSVASDPAGSLEPKARNDAKSNWWKFW